MRPALLLALLLAACSTRGTYQSGGEVPIVVWLLPGEDGPGPAYAHPSRSSRVDLYGPIGVVDDLVVYAFRGPEDRMPEEAGVPADWKTRHAVVFEPTGERVQGHDGVWEGYRRVERERADAVIEELDATRRG